MPPKSTRTTPALQPILAACREHDAVALAGAPIVETAGRFIAVLRNDADGVRVVSRKRWLHGDESQHFSAGEGPYTTDLDGLTVGVAICKDSVVAEHTAQFARMNIDLYFAGILDTPGEEEERTARSAETAQTLGVPVAISNYRGATSLYAVTAGTSAIYGADGRELARVEQGQSFAVYSLTATARERPNTNAPTTTSTASPITPNDNPAYPRSASTGPARAAPAAPATLMIMSERPCIRSLVAPVARSLTRADAATVDALQPSPSKTSPTVTAVVDC